MATSEVLQCLFSGNISSSFYISDVQCSKNPTSYSSLNDDNSNTCTNRTQCLSPRAIRITYYVGGSLILLLVLAVVILSVLLCCIAIRGRKQKKKRGSRHFTEEGLSTDEANSQSANYTLEDSFESVDAVEDSNTLDTVVNNKYDTIELKRKATSAEGDKENEAAAQASSTKKKNKKKKAKKSIPDVDKKKNPEYNKLVHGPDSKGPIGIDKDSYSVLDKPKKVVQEIVEVNTKVKELPLIPSRQNEMAQNAVGANNQVPRADPYEDVPIVKGEAKKEGLSDTDQTKPEKVYYNESAALVSKIVEATENGKHETEERRLNIYTHSISL